MGKASERRMDPEELHDIESIFREVIGLRAAGRPIDAAEERCVRISRAAMQVLRHAQAIGEELQALKREMAVSKGSGR